MVLIMVVIVPVSMIVAMAAPDASGNRARRDRDKNHRQQCPLHNLFWFFHLVTSCKPWNVHGWTLVEKTHSEMGCSPQFRRGKRGTEFTKLTEFLPQTRRGLDPVLIAECGLVEIRKFSPSTTALCRQRAGRSLPAASKSLHRHGLHMPVKKKLVAHVAMDRPGRQIGKII